MNALYKEINDEYEAVIFIGNRLLIFDHMF